MSRSLLNHVQFQSHYALVVLPMHLGQMSLSLSALAQWRSRAILPFCFDTFLTDRPSVCQCQRPKDNLRIDVCGIALKNSYGFLVSYSSGSFVTGAGGTLHLRPRFAK